MRLVVLKLGGSLLVCPDLRDRLKGVLREFASSRVVIVVGGGEAADVVRGWSRQHALSEESAHWIAVRSLSVTRALVAERIPECVEVASLDEATRLWSAGAVPLLADVERLLRQAESTDAAPLPHTWDVTSDSIAAWIAARWSADELVLLKSTGMNPGITPDHARRDGLVDGHFPQVAAKVPCVRWCNLLEDGPRIATWMRRGDVVTV